MITDTDLIKAQLKAGNTTDLGKIIKDYINENDTSKMNIGERYYNNNNDILNRKMYYWENGSKVEDETKTNNKVSHNWHKLLVDQKTSYLFGKPVNFNADDENFTKDINSLLGEEFDDILQELGKESSNKGVAWLQPYIDEAGQFEFDLIKSQEVIPIWKSNKQKELQAVIRYYLITLNGKDRIYAEYWTDKDVTFYIQSDNGEFELDIRTDSEGNTEPNPQSHFYYNQLGYGWGKVPFIAFKNNEEMVYDLQFYKSLIDIYDRNVSDLANNLEDVQEVITVLKGYMGTDLKEFNDNLRFFKTILVEEKGGVDKLEINIPVEAKKELLNRLEENIFMFGQGVNTKTDKFGNSPSGVSLKFLYALLDLKANITERKFRRSIKELLWFLCEYLKISPKHKKNYDYKTVQVVFNKTMITNDKEMSEIASSSVGIISNETIRMKHPWVEDIVDENKRMEKQEEDSLTDYNINPGGEE